MTKKFKILILFLSIALVLSINGCDLIKAKKTKSVQASNNEVSNQASIQDSITNPAKKDSVQADNSKPVDPPKKTSFAYTRENPFLPLISEQSPNAAKPTQKSVEEKEKKPEPPEIEKPVREVMISLNGVISGSTAFFSEDGLSKTLSVGDTISGMRILEINKGEVILNKDNMRYKIKTGEQLKIKAP